MTNRIGVKQATSLATVLTAIALCSVGGADNIVEKRIPSIADQELFFAPVPKAVCGPGDKPEPALQGQVPAAVRAAGFGGYSCNLTLIGQVKDEGANWQTTEWREGRGRNRKACAYHGSAHTTANPTIPRAHYGTRVIDISDPAKPSLTTYLTSVSMLDPWESLKTNQRRKLLGAVNGANGNGPAAIDIYDVSGDCRFPQLLTSTLLAVDPSTGVLFPGLTGHEGSWAPDGLTYYARGMRNYYAVDTTNLLAPKLTVVWQVPDEFAVSTGHGLSVSDDGNRGYFVAIAPRPLDLFDPSVQASNGLLIYDLTDIQNRRANLATPKILGTVFWKDGSTAQHTINIKIGKKPYVVFVDEGGASDIASGAQFARACAAQLAPFPMARIIDISDETKPRVVSKLMLETHDPANCDKVAPDVAGLTTFTYGSHYCSVDNIHNATTVACGYFNSGIRIFDVRDPIRPREIAYYNPPATTAPGGSTHAAQRAVQPGGGDWCSAQVHLDADTGTVWSTCQDNGFLMMKFTHNAWPFAETRTPPGMQN